MSEAAARSLPNRGSKARPRILPLRPAAADDHAPHRAAAVSSAVAASRAEPTASAAEAMHGPAPFDAETGFVEAALAGLACSTFAKQREVTLLPAASCCLRTAFTTFCGAYTQHPRPSQNTK